MAPDNTCNKKKIKKILRVNLLHFSPSYFNLHCFINYNRLVEAIIMKATMYSLSLHCGNCTNRLIEAIIMDATMNILTERHS